MTDADKVQALTELLFTVIHTLEMKQYDIENPKMLKILYSEDS